MEAQLDSVVTAQTSKTIVYPEPPKANTAKNVAAKREVPTVYTELVRTKPIAHTPQEVLAAHAHLSTMEGTSATELGLIFIVAAAAFGASFAVGANRFSMHALYRNRLIRAYLGASRYDRDPDRVTGFDPYDNIQMYKLRPELLWTSSFLDVAKFIDELRKAIAGTPGNPLSDKLVDMLQETTLDALVDASTLNAVVNHLSAATLVMSKVELALRAVDRVRRQLPRTANLLSKDANATIGRLLAVAQGELGKWQPDNEGSLVDTVVQDLNRILIEKDLIGNLPDTALRAACNRYLFDQAYSEWVIAMAPYDLTEIMPVIAMAPGDHKAAVPAKQLAARAPLHVVNTALNLVSGDNLAWQQRQAESFTISPLHCGSAFVGYRDSCQYGDALRGISLGTAVAISGAAASPNQGYHSSLPLAFLMTMFNVRLGSWLGNPGAAGKKTYDKDNPSSMVALLAREMIGDTSDTYPWVYLSDGGHFENLALYEMVLRRCRYIVVSDGGCDPKFTFEDLGNAIRKIRTDFGIPIEFDQMPMHSRDDDSPWGYAAVGTIKYAAVDGDRAPDGSLIYVKPGYYPDERLPKDVVNYAKECSDFPHETTADQWFSESQFESYRMLGRHVVDHFAPSATYATFAEFTTSVAKERQETAYVPVVAEQIRLSGDKRPWRAVVLPTQPKTKARR